jgi:hypothetical protein
MNLRRLAASRRWSLQSIRYVESVKRTSGCAIESRSPCPVRCDTKSRHSRSQAFGPLRAISGLIRCRRSRAIRARSARPSGGVERCRAYRLSAGSHHAHSKRRRLQKIPSWHAGPKEHDPRIGWSACRACPVLDRRCPGKHHIVDCRLLAVRCHDALQFVSLGKSPVCVTLQVQSHCAVPVQQLDGARAGAIFCPLLPIAAPCPGEIGTSVINCIAVDLEARCERLNRLGGVAFGPNYAGCCDEMGTQRGSHNESAGSHLHPCILTGARQYTGRSSVGTAVLLQRGDVCYLSLIAARRTPASIPKRSTSP